MLISFYGRDTQHAFGHNGFMNILTWADPDRALSAALITSRKALLDPEFPRYRDRGIDELHRSLQAVADECSVGLPCELHVLLRNKPSPGGEFRLFHASRVTTARSS